MSYHKTYDPNDQEQVAAALRKEIRAARLKVTLDKKQGRVTSPQVKMLARMALPPLTRTRRTNAVQSAAQRRPMASSAQ